MNHNQQALGQLTANEHYGLGYMQYDWATLNQIAQQNILGQCRAVPEPKGPDFFAITRDVAGR